MTPSRRLRAVMDAALAAGRVIRKYYEKSYLIRSKGAAGLVTQADVEAEAAALKILTRAEPEFGVYAEETAPDERVGVGGRWILDPLDGTTNFVHGFPMFCVSIAGEVFEGAKKDGRKMQVAAIYHPIFNDLYVAERGKGAWLNGKRIHVSTRRKIQDSLLTTGFAYNRGERLHEGITLFERVSKQARAVRRPGSAAMDLAYTARGVFDGFWEAGLSAWDVAAGALLVTEAGGKVTGMDGKAFDVESRQILATNGNLHPLLTRLLAVHKIRE
jgi:myo-inositol-1(or 4)-monophosphatase